MAGLTKKPQLPKAVLDMKFMRKTKERLQKESANTAGHESLYSKEITTEMRNATSNYIVEASLIFCEELIEGRLSFKGMNPEIERIMELENVKKEVDSGEMQKDVSDEILAKKMEAFHKRKRPYGSPSNYIAKKRK